MRFWLHEFDCSILLGVLSREFLREFWLCEFGVGVWLYKFGCAILVAGFWWGFVAWVCEFGCVRFGVDFLIV